MQRSYVYLIYKSGDIGAGAIAKKARDRRDWFRSKSGSGTSFFLSGNDRNDISLSTLIRSTLSKVGTLRTTNNEQVNCIRDYISDPRSDRRETLYIAFLLPSPAYPVLHTEVFQVQTGILARLDVILLDFSPRLRVKSDVPWGSWYRSENWKGSYLVPEYTPKPQALTSEAAGNTLINAGLVP